MGNLLVTSVVSGVENNLFHILATADLIYLSSRTGNINHFFYKLRRGIRTGNINNDEKENNNQI